ncbi:hypothetical protein BGY98DRAFT_153154 [Russula aff. rugulosa BPL654]|nr:hypothetical protein BGY98DRAFT_153154 [Russula aff. rugulosa BPL654]
MIGVMPVAISYFIPVNPSVCKGLHVYREWFMVTIQTHAGILCLLRVYALYGRSRRILVLLIFFAMGSFVTAVVSLFFDRKAGGETIPVISPFGGCAQYTPDIGGRFTAIAWVGAFVGDTAIFFLTLYKSFMIGRGVKLLDMIVRDGTMYFSLLSLMNLGNIMTLLHLLKTSVTLHTNVLATILVNRLVLNLRERAATNQLPTTFESAGRFQAALPVYVSRQLLSKITLTDGISSFFRQNVSTGIATATRETAASVPARVDDFGSWT